MKNKKNKHNQAKSQQAQNKPTVSGISSVGKKVIFAGICVLSLGFFVLTKTDPAGQNLASNVSPFLILGGYALIGIGIAIPEKQTTSSQQQ
ncbi:MAG TPA: hypothetical protein DEE98_00105 [Elusimicrobia bacterium]|nr:MAG: hypothetical protein A2278_03800 [Elusimicrobia bacterium RIFOXYA12_FULL_49_49]OGS08915.1 MAG: hypothetical protein A2204_00765 [Elusimicrobia bacterium RIFOXYA1_FULL_47_7]OGS09508.1 MAG: hypothetical protein A2386_00955 [Elusimicrobia bacterium RIFOXYB1_FULL_48_9]OGS15286.1 MAG: hypothetical protein A2251_07115 [Elusimicrobia bacterium RIFOXYA2_FULL_47_53]OGS26560.1 MAG: hypothetical protein A2339_07005 [Elusimicrobia bacterium RIFOXYB12_FULL_50_12]OGS30541.1 MAG: hypothetical protein